MGSGAAPSRVVITRGMRGERGTMNEGGWAASRAAQASPQGERSLAPDRLQLQDTVLLFAPGDVKLDET